MMRIATLFAVLQLFVWGSAAHAQTSADDQGTYRSVVTQTWVEEWDPVKRRWVRVADGSDEIASQALPIVTTHYVNGMQVSQTQTGTLSAPSIAPRNAPVILGQYGPFIVTSETKAAMVGATDTASPAYFDAMLRDFPAIAQLDMIEAPGTSNDIANLAVGRQIREAGIATHVPNGGSVRSGAVELFLAGAERTLEEGAQFAVHSWLDNHGREADDFAADHPAHRLYLDYYVEMGMSETQARDFYTMTNSVPHHSALWLQASDMRPWLRSPRVAEVRMALAQESSVTYGSDKEVLALVDAKLPRFEMGDLTLNLVQPVFSAQKPVLAYGDLYGVALASIEPSHS